MHSWKGLLLLCLTLASCVSPQFPPFTAKSSSLALAQWNLGGNPLIFDAVLALSPDNALKITLLKQTATPLLEMQFGPGDQAFARGLLIGRSWRGSLSNAPLPLSPWVAASNVIRNAEVLPDGEREIHTGVYKAAVSKSAGKLRTLSILSEDTGDVLTLRFRN